MQADGMLARAHSAATSAGCVTTGKFQAQQAQTSSQQKRAEAAEAKSAGLQKELDAAKSSGQQLMEAGQKIQLAIFGINGPISNPPTNFIWVREAKLDFYKNASTGPVAITPSEVNIEVVRNDDAINKIIE